MTSGRRWRDRRRSLRLCDTGRPSLARRRIFVASVAIALLASAGTLPATGGAVTVSLGDSYSSGEGARSYDAGTDREGNKCHRSSLAWPRLLGVPLFGHLACSGATTVHMQTGKTAQPPDNRGQLARLEALAKQTKIDRVFVGIGGNDLGFSSIIRSCVIGIGCLNDIDGVEAQKLQNMVGPRIVTVLRAARTASGGGEVVLVGYPDIAPRAGAKITNCSWLSDTEAERLRRLEELFDQEMRAAAGLAGAFYVSTRTALAGHELCTRDSWVRPVATARGTSVEQGHPDARGQVAVGNAVRQTLVSQRLFYVSGNTLSTATLRTEQVKRTTLFGRPASRKIGRLALSGDRVFSIESLFGFNPTRLYSASRDGQARTLLAGAENGISDPQGVAFARGRVWFIWDEGIGSVRGDGTDLQPLVYPLPLQDPDGTGFGGSGNDLGTDGRYLYFPRCAGKSIGRVDLESGEINPTWVDFSDTRRGDCFQGIAVGPSHIYVYNPGFFPGDVGTIGRVHTSGIGFQRDWLKLKRLGGTAAIETDGQYIYFDHGGGLRSAPKKYEIARMKSDRTGLNYAFLSGRGGFAIAPPALS